MKEIRTLVHDFPKALFYTSIGITIASIIDINTIVHRKKIIFFAVYILYIIKDFIILIDMQLDKIKVRLLFIEIYSSS